MANFTELGKKIGSKIDSDIEKAKAWTKAHKKHLIIGGAAIGAVGAGAAALTVYKNQKNEPETIPGPIDEDELNTDTSESTEVSKEEAL